jgi:trigger factor
MEVTETLKDGLRREYAFRLPASELDAKVNEKLEEARKDFQMKGFRKGKAPLPLMKKMFGKSVLGEAMQETIDAAMRSHFEATGDRPAFQPEVRMTREDWQEGQDVEVSVRYERLPEVPEVDFKTIAIEKPVATVEDAAVDEALANLAKSANSFEDKDGAAEDGDQVVLDFTGSVDGEEFEGGKAEDYPIVLGSGSFIPGFEDQLKGAKAGDSPEIRVRFPENYGARHLAGKEAVFAVTVKAVKAPKPAAIDDDLAKRFGLDSLEALRTTVRERLAAEYGQATRAIVKRRLMDALDAAVKFEVPPRLVDVEAKQIAHQLWHEEHPEVKGHDHGPIEPTDDHLKLAERRVRLGLLLAEIGNKQGITVTDQEMQRAVIAQARQYPGQERQFLEFVQKNAGAQSQIRAPIFEDKVVDYILELAAVSEKPVTKDELQAEIARLDEIEAAEAGASGEPQADAADSTQTEGERG